MTKLEKQWLFTRLVAEWLLAVYALGYRVVLGEALRTEEQAALHAGRGKGIYNSAHRWALAQDFALFKDGIYLAKSEEYEEVGVLWESMHELCRWGGRFDDGGHISMEHQGRK